jgi:hypothetical protein
MALHCDDPLALIVEGLHDAWTDVMLEDCCAVTRMDVLPDSLGFWILVAVTVIEPAVAGAVKTPLEFTAPLLADH